VTAPSTRPVVGLLTDFGLVDDAVGICKGMLLTIAPDAHIVDITHQVTPFDVVEASHYIRDSFRYFPPGAVFACVTFPLTGVRDDAVAVRTRTGHLYCAPNNGLLTRVVTEAGVEQVHRITAPQVRQAVVDPTFYGRDIVLSAAAHLAAGTPLDQVGPALTSADIVLLPVAEPEWTGDGAVGEVALLDKNFGNVWTTLSRRFLVEHGIDVGTELELTIGPAQVVGPLRETFGEVPVGEPVIYVASRGHLGVALNQGDFATTRGIRRGQRVLLRKR
jgi:S-adenosylmethionine hydrolase